MPAATGSHEAFDSTESLPAAVYSTAQVRAFDRAAIDDIGIPGFELMQRAGRAAFAALRRHFSSARSLSICCGGGNNGGDGYVVAGLAADAGFEVQVLALADPEGLAGDAAKARDAARQAGVGFTNVSEHFAADITGEVIVDAVFGTGLGRTVEGRFADAVAAINASRRPVIALDVPSGLDSDTGRVHGTAVRADLTVTFVGLKQGLYLGRAPEHVGLIEFSGLGIPASVVARAVPTLRRLVPETLADELSPRSRTAHKVLNGRVLLIGGSSGMAGAIRLAGEAALRAGAGLVHIGTHPSSVPIVMAGRPELMCRGIESPDDLGAWREAVDAIVIGPGLGQDDWGRRLFDALIDSPVPLVVDADGLNLLSRTPRRREAWLLTPHPGEAARLLGRGAADVQADRLGAVTGIAARYGADVILKGASSLVAESVPQGPAPCFVCDRGNPGMATAGTGDVLAGIAGALAAERRGIAGVGRLAVLVHALAGDDAATDGERGMIASDLLAAIRRRVNPR